MGRGAVAKATFPKVTGPGHGTGLDRAGRGGGSDSHIPELGGVSSPSQLLGLAGALWGSGGGLAPLWRPVRGPAQSLWGPVGGAVEGGAVEGRSGEDGQRELQTWDLHFGASWEDVGFVSSRQLQPEEPDAETKEDHSVTEGSVDEIIRPRPQGSSPIYEYVTEGASFGLPEDTPRRRRSWWKRDSGASQTHSRMSRLESTQEATGGTLKTKVEAGASGYIVTRGGDQGIFVKQVLKESSAAKLFSLREGDQLLSTTIFFDDIKYEDALKILQYSEPYKVQFTIKRELPAREDEEGASGGAQRGSRGSKEQDQDIADGCTETPTKTLQEDGDQERLISKPREGRGRQPQRERLSWPKFQALKSKRGPGPRRSHSSSEAYERGDVPDLPPTSTDTEAQLPEEEQVPEAGPGSQRKRSFPNLRFRVGSGKGLSGRGAHGGTVQAGVLVETGPWDSGREAVRAAAHGGREDRTAGVPEEAEPPTEPGLPSEGAPGEGAGPAPIQSREGAREGTHALEIGIARLSLQDSADRGSHQNHQPEFHIRIPTLKPPKFGLYKEEVLEKEGATTALQGGPWQRRVSGEDTEAKGEDAGEAETHRTRQPPVHQDALPAQEGGETEEDAARKGEEDSEGGDQHTEEKEGKMEMLKFKLPSFGWSPAKEAKGDKVTQLQETEKEKESSITVVTSETDIKDKDGLETDSKFKMPKFKMPSFGVSVPRKSVEAAVEVSKAQAEVTLPSVQANVKTSDLSIELPSAELEVKAAEVGMKLPEGHIHEAEPKEAAAGIGLKGHLPKVQVPSIKVPKGDIKVPKGDIKAPQVDIKGPKLDLKDTKGEVMAPDLEVSLPSVEVDTQSAGTKPADDVSLGDKEVAARDSKFKMPKFKMPSFGVSVPSKSVKATVEVSVPKAQAEVTLPSVQAGGKTSDLNIELPSAELEVKATEEGVKLPEGHIAEAEPKEVAAGIGLKGHLPSVQMPSIKVPKVDIKGPKLDLKEAKGEVTAPDVELSLPSVEVDTQATGIMLEGDVSLGEKEVAARDSKFKMPKFKMPSFGVSAPSKSVEAAVEVSVPKAQADVTLPSLQADVKTSDLSIEQPSAELDVKAAEVGVKLPEDHLPEAEPKEVAAGIGLKGHLPKVQMPSIKVPKVDIKAPQVDIKGPKLDLKDTKGEVMAPDVEVSLPSVEVDNQSAGTKPADDVSLGDKEVAARDSKFKMPKFKMPSFGVSAPSKSVKATVEVSVPKAQAEVTLPSVQADGKTSDLNIELPSAELEVKAAEEGVKLPEGHIAEAGPKEVAAGIGLKGHLPKVQIPSIKVPKVDIKGPKLDLKEAKGEMTTPDVEVSLPSVEVDTQAAGSKLEGDVSLGDKEVAARDSKFKMPKFKVPSFGVSAPSKSVEATVEVSVPKAQADVTLPSVQADLKTNDLSIELPSAELEVKAAEVGVKLPEGHLPEAEPKEAAAGIGLKGHLPKVQMPSIKVPKVDIKGPKLDLQDDKGEVTTPDMEVSPPSVKVDTQATGIMLEGDVSLGDKDVAARDSKFKMPKFKMPSLGVLAPRKSVEAAVEVSVPKAQAEVTLPSVQADVKTSDLSIELPSAELEVKVPEVGVKLPEGHLPEAEPKEAAAGIGLKGHLPKVQMPSIKVPKVDIKGPKLDLKDAKGEVTAPEVEMALPSVEVDTQAAGTKLEGDVSLGDKEVAARDSKFKMPKFKMPSFGVSAPSKSVKATVEVSVPKAQAEVTLPSVQADGKTSDLNIELPSAELEVKAAEEGVKLPEGHIAEAGPKEVAAGIGLKGHLPKVQIPSIKVPKVDIKGPKLDLKEAKGEMTTPDVEVSLPSVEVDTQAAGSKLEGDVSLGDKEVAARDSKFKMPKFKVPSFGVSAPSKSVEATVEVSVPKAQADVTLPSVQADLKTNDLSIELPSAELEVKAAEVGVKLPEGHLPEAEPKEAAAGIGLKGHLPKVQMPSIKVPKVDIKGPKLDLQDDKGEVTTPDMEVSPPSVKVDTQATGIMLEGDVSLGDKDVAARDSKFKMPKFKMPSLGVLAPRKSVEAAVEVSVPKAQAEVTLPSVQADVKTSDLSIELPSAELEVKVPEVGVKLPEGHLPEAEPKEAAAGIGLKGHLPKVQMPSIKVPKVDIKGPKLDLKDAKGEVTAPEVEMALPSVEVDTQAAGTKLEGDVSLGDKEVAARDSKFKMPKFKMPSFGVLAPSKSVKATVEVSVPKAQAEVTLPSLQADGKISDLSIELPSAELEVKAAEVGVKLPEGHLPEAEPKEAVAGIGLKGHLPKVPGPSIKLPEVYIKAPQVDIKGPKLDLKDAKVEVTASNMEVSLPSVEVDTQVAGSKLAGDVSLGDKEVTTRDSKFKTRKFSMPSFGVSVPSKSDEAAVEVSVPKAQAEVTLPSVQANVKTSDFSIELPSAGLEVKAAEVGVKLPEGHIAKAEPKEVAAGIGLKGHLPSVQMPSIKVPKVDIKAPQVDIKGPKVEQKDDKGEVMAPNVEVSLPSMEVDTQAARSKLEGDVSLGDKEVAVRDSKFKMPKFKMPSFGVSAPSKSIEAALEESVPKAQAQVTLPSVQADLKTSDLSIELPSAELGVKAAEVGVKLPEGQLPRTEPEEVAVGSGLKGHLPRVQMPSIKVPKVDIKAPQVDIKGPKVDLKDDKGKVMAPNVEVSLPSMEVDTQAAGSKLAGDVSLGDKEVAARDSKFKMLKIKMPSFGVSAPSKSVKATVEVSVPKAQAEVTLPSVQADGKTSDLSIELPSAELDVKATEVGMKLPEGHLPEAEPKEVAAGIGLKGHLPKVQMPSIKVPKVDIKSPQVDIKGPKLDLKDDKGEVMAPGVEVSLPSVEVDTLAAGSKLEGDVSLRDKEVAVRDSKFKMPKFKMPSFRGVSVPSKSVEAALEGSVPKAQAEVTLPSVQADGKTSDLSIEQPSAELDVKATEVGVRLPEGHLAEAEPKEVAAGIGLKGHLPKVQMPSIKVPKVDIKAPHVDIKGPKLDLKDAKGEVTVPDVEVSLPSVEVDTQAAGSKLEGDVSLGDKEVAPRVRNIKMEGGGNIQIKKSHFKVPKFFSSSDKSFKSSSPVGVNFGVSLPPSTSVTFSEFSGGGSLTQDLATREPSVPLAWLGWPGFSGSLDLSGTHAEPASLSPAEGIILTKYQVTLPGAAVPPELPLEAAPCSQNDAHLPSTESSARLPTQERVAVSQTDCPAGPVDPMFLASYGRVSFPKFHPPKFGFSVPEVADAEVEAGAGDCAPSLSTTGPARGLDSTAVPRSAGPSAVAAGETPAKDTERGGKDSPLKMPWIKLPSFMWSPKKGTVPPGDPERSLDAAELGLAVDTGPKGVPPGCPVSAAEVAVHALPDKDGEGRGVKSPGCAVLEHAPPTAPAPGGGPGLPRGDPAAPRSRPPAGGGARATERAGGAAGAGGTGTVVGPEGAGADLRLPQAHAPLLDFARPDLRPSKAKVGVSSSAGGPPSLGHSSQGHGLQDGSASQPLGEATAPSVGDPQQPSCSPANVDVPAVETAASPGGWFRMPALRLPSIRRPAKERGAAGAQGAPVPAPAASALREGERPALVKGQGVPGSEVEEAMSLQPPEAGADEAAAELASYADADILKRNLEEKGSEPHLSAAGVPAADLSPSEVRVRPGEGSLPLQMPSGRLSGTQVPLGEMGTAPPGPAGLDLAAGEGRAEEWSSQPEGPIKLKASRTDGPSQVSVVNMGQPWEGSVVTVKLPRLSVPRFAFPDPSSEADIFIPAVTEVRCPGSSLAHALHEESPGVWGASILKAGAGTPGEQPMTLDFSPEASPISKVRMHTQRAQGESPEVAVHSRVTAELADLSGPEAISTQVVRQLEIPASEIQTASCGFSLRTVKMPEPRTQVSVRGSRLREGLQEASKQATPGADPASGDLQPDTGEPFEVISSSVDVPGRPTFTPKVHSGHQGADSCSDDEEAAEILEFPPEEDSREAATSLAEEDRAPKEKPEGKRSSGLFRFWLPSIGFSSSAEETRAHSKDEARLSAPVQTQPGARPEAEPPKKPETAGWFRFPKLGFSSSHTEKSKSSEDEAPLAEQKLQEQAVTFFDAPESFSPEDKGAGEPAETAGARPGARAMTTSTARTELVLLEQDPEGGMNLHPGPPPSEDRRTDERRPCEAATVRACVSTLIHSTESEAEMPERGGAPPSHSPPKVGPQTCRRPRASAAEAASGLPTRPCAPEDPH
ncbi:protein AHNAK2 [Eubalaena glacialis]|uniref:protein AHNAK2 n=1 Tax=Eubalaena glacialis TaxID=27606 RepID=UPI002A59D553|nr:protein AHNAK2 [Eubalaena glacialis]